MKLRKRDWEEAQEFIFFQSETQFGNSKSEEEREDEDY